MINAAAIIAINRRPRRPHQHFYVLEMIVLTFGGANAASGDGEFVVLGIPVFLWCLNTSFDIWPTDIKSILSSRDIYGAGVDSAAGN